MIILYKKDKIKCFFKILLLNAKTAQTEPFFTTIIKY